MRNAIFLLLFASAICIAQTGKASLSYGSSGLTSIQYNNTEYLSTGKFGINGVNFINAAGQITPGSTSGTYAYDVTHRRTTITLDWGTIVASYAASGNQVSLTMTTTNSSSQTLQGLFLEPIDMILPSAPQEFDGTDPILGVNIGTPTVLRMTAGTNAVILANDDVVRPLLVAFPWSLNKPANTIFPVRVETSQDSMLPNNIPFVNRPVAPGASDSYHLSLRFGTAAATTKSLVADVYQNFATAYPLQVNWADRRPIGQLIIGTTAAGWPTNPRGWFNDPTLDVTTPTGVAAFQSRLLAWAATSVGVLKSMNAQGMVTWDIEGEQYPQPTTYIGDPTLFGKLAPEMQTVIDQYFQVFINAGLRTGICIRPQQLVIPAGGGAPIQTAVADPTSLLLKKIGYANKRWGATLFYIDSNGDPNYPMTPSFFRAVAAQYPNVLLIPENQTDGYYSVAAPYDELKGGVAATPQAVLDIYPSAFSVIYTPDGNFAQYQATLQGGVKRGDILMFRAWYADPQNQQVLSLFPTNGVAPPVPTVATPTNHDTVNGIVNLTAEVTAPNGVDSVEYLLDGASLGSAGATPPYALALDSGPLTTGIHNLQAVASDPVGDLGFASIDLFVGEMPANAPPQVVFSSPLNGLAVSGTVALSALVSDSLPVAQVQLLLDGLNLGAPMAAAPYEIAWDTGGIGNGPHTIAATATDTSGAQGRAAITVIVNN